MQGGKMQAQRFEFPVFWLNEHGKDHWRGSNGGSVGRIALVPEHGIHFSQIPGNRNILPTGTEGGAICAPIVYPPGFMGCGLFEKGSDGAIRASVPRCFAARVGSIFSLSARSPIWRCYVVAVKNSFARRGDGGGRERVKIACGFAYHGFGTCPLRRDRGGSRRRSAGVRVPGSPSGGRRRRLQ